MTIDDYADWAARNARLTAPGTISREQVSYLGLGLAGEAGETVEHIKKYLRDGEFRAEAMADELGDVAYYWACLCLAAGRKPSEVLAESVTKIERKVRSRKDPSRSKPS